jgi:hypothetical protein
LMCSIYIFFKGTWFTSFSNYDQCRRIPGLHPSRRSQPSTRLYILSRGGKDFANAVFAFINAFDIHYCTFKSWAKRRGEPTNICHATPLDFGGGGEVDWKKKKRTKIVHWLILTGSRIFSYWRHLCFSIETHNFRAGDDCILGCCTV